MGKVKIYMMIGGILSILFLKAQEAIITPRQVRIDIANLCDYSQQYNKYSQLSSNKFDEQRSKFNKLYRDQIYKIKHGTHRAVYKEFLDKATGIDSLKYKNEKGYEYTYTFSLVSRRIDTMPTLLEFFKVVKYSLFTLDKEELLPPKDVPFLKYKVK